MRAPIPEFEIRDDLRLVVLFGSRASGDSHERSDWDFAYIAGDGFDSTQLHQDLVTSLNTERVDLVNLLNASGLLRYETAKTGQVLFDAGDEWNEFRIDAVSFWFDQEPILQDAYKAVLGRL